VIWIQKSLKKPVDATTIEDAAGPTQLNFNVLRLLINTVGEAVTKKVRENRGE
jgi:hypothetical protein